MFRFSWRRTLLYLLMAIASAPAIHATFSFFLGWGEYMPFWNIPSVYELLHA